MSTIIKSNSNSWPLSPARQSITDMFIGIVRSRQSEGNALARLQSDALLEGIAGDPKIEGGLIDPRQSAPRFSRPGAVLAFHYHDEAAVDYVRAVRRADHGVVALCLGGDIYSYLKYARLQDFVTAFVAPTSLHKQILAYRLAQPVHVLEEAVDPIALGGRQSDEIEGYRFSDRPRSRRLVWFGYSESFHKGMDSLIPTITGCLRSGDIDAFDLVLDTGGFRNPFALPQIPFETSTFFETISGYDYAILSHFPLDLHLNSYIKSPNKLITSLMCGLIPIASDTPAYREVMTRFGLERLMFDSPASLRRILSELDPQSDALLLDSAAPLESILRRNSSGAIYGAFLRIVREVRARPALAALEPIASTSDESPPPTFRSHLRDLLPSFIRGIRRRLPK